MTIKWTDKFGDTIEAFNEGDGGFTLKIREQDPDDDGMAVLLTPAQVKELVRYLDTGIQTVPEEQRIRTIVAEEVEKALAARMPKRLYPENYGTAYTPHSWTCGVPQAEREPSHASAWNERVLKSAIEKNTEVEFSYTTPDGSVSWRRVQPFKIIDSRSGSAVIGYQDGSTDDVIRTFRLDRINGYVRSV